MLVVLLSILVLTFQTGCIRRGDGPIRIVTRNNRLTVTDTCDGIPRHKSIQLTASGKSKFSFCSDLRLIGRLIHSEPADPSGGDHDEIGIGPKSDLVRKFGNVALVADEMVLGDSGPISWFNANCDPSSEVFISISEFDDGMVGSLGHIGASGEELVIQIHGDTEYPFIVPNLNTLISEVNRRFPALEIGSGKQFECNRDLIDLMKPLDFVFRSGIVRIEPIHYIEQVKGMCRLKVREMRSTAAINPLAIPDKNVRFSRTTIEICDRLVPQVF